jgi:AraC family transcriptional regulator
MSYILKINKGIDFIENHLQEDFTLAAVAQHAGLSQWYFQRIFSALTGETLKNYIRARRLSQASKALIQTEMRIIEIALDAGYESQESFTRAFQECFGLSPGDFRKRKNPHLFMEKIKIDREYLKHISMNLEKNPEIITIPAKMYVGLSTLFYGVESEKNNMADKLTSLWRKFLPRMSDIPNSVPGTGYGLMRQVGDPNGQLEYLCAMEVSEIPKTLPKEMVSITIEKQKYAKFLHRGNVKEMNHTVNYIYSTWLLNSEFGRADGVDIEEYGQKYHPTSLESEVYYLLPIA